ncbi:MmcQ/YjbR family DNA-binding protein [Actinoplanes sp. LDG1-06]|uniref:MmcQ/YjbR family DNA-binding protein n=1 Tax=Paractinoplanes ovalisporus TaxID=2810368 RepID=A0ABS2A9Y2_9ACTN|nr:MmcQ/YjbR family DNA-binding protein [Actinoplanes ovalisporus]MBM2616651.1 MmcQ/YjbR family DNA-binding protein [Actinoplanes ovalisporus]
MSGDERPARVEDVHALATAMPDVVVGGDDEHPGFSVGGKTFIFFREPRKDAFDPETGERYTDVIAFHVESEDDKQALVQDESTPFFTTPHWNGYRAVLLLARDLGRLSRAELAEIVQDAWLARAPKRAAKAWRESRPG